MLTSVDETKINQTRTQLETLVRDLLEALENNDREKAMAAQQAFTGTIASLWSETDEINIDRKLKAILRLVAGWAITELPKQIQDPVSDETVRRELKLFQRSLMMFNE
jgi:hypothetical protein